MKVIMGGVLVENVLDTDFSEIIVIKNRIKKISEKLNQIIEANKYNNLRSSSKCSIFLK